MEQQLVRLALLCMLFGTTAAMLNGSFPNSELDGTALIRAKIGSSLRPKYCYMKTTTICENINSTSVGSPGMPPTLWCLGTKLPYTTVSLDLLPSVTSLTEMLEIVESWEVLRRIPKCWAVVQPLICAYHLPRCEDDTLVLPSQEMCRLALGPCKLLGLRPEGYPEFLNCSNEKIFPPYCKNNIRELKFNTTATCPFPLVPVPPPSGITMFTDPQRHYPGLEGCSLPCETPLFSPHELERLQRLIAWGGTIAVILNLFVVSTFIVDWGSSARYPALIVFYMNLCCLISNLGWLLQFVPGARSDILCRKDGTARGAEPSMGENLSCVMVFVIIYYFLMAALVWFVIFAYSWHNSFKYLGRKKENTESKSAYYHLAAWSGPLVLTIATLAVGEVYPDSSSGICFVGTAGGNLWGAEGSSIMARFVLLIGPILLATIIGGFFLVRGVVALVQIQIESKELVSHRAIQHIQAMVVRLAIFSAGVMCLVLLTFACHVYEFKHADSWHSALHKSITCHALGKNPLCLLSSQPSLSVAQLHMLAPFLLSVLVASWLFNSQSKETWKRILKRKLPCCVAPYYDDPRALALMERQRVGDIQERPTRDINLQKRKVIARAFAKRGIFKNEGRLSFSFRSSHGDPVGMNFEMDSQPSSKGFSSSWANKLPRLMKRRGAFPKFDSESTARGRHSVESDVGISFRKVSVESRRNSLDSQVSLTISEIVARHQTRGSRTRHKHRGHGVKDHPRSRHRHRDKRSKWGSRSSQIDQISQVEFHTSQIQSSRRSSVSSDSQSQNGLHKILQALQMPGPSGIENFNIRPSSRQLTQRRAALTEAPSLSLMARLQLHGSSGISDEETNSRNGDALELQEIPADPESGPKIIEIRDDFPHNGHHSSHDDTSDESSSSSSSDSPEPRAVNGASPKYHHRRSHDKIIMNGSNHSSKHHQGAVPKVRSQNSHKKRVSSDSSSSSAEEETPFLTVAQITASRDSNTSFDRVTRDIGVQVCFEPDSIKKSPRRKSKNMTKSFNVQLQKSDRQSQSSRSKSAGVY